MLGPEAGRELVEDQAEIAARVALIGGQDAADVEQDLGDAGSGGRRLGHRRIGSDQPVHDHGVAVLLAVGLQELARIVDLAQPAQALGDGDRGAQARRVERNGAAILGFGGSLVARHLVDLRLDHQGRRLGALARGGLQLGEMRARGGELLLARLQPGQHVFAQRTELVLRADLVDLLLGGAKVALLDRLHRQDEVGEAVARPRRQDLGRELGRGVDTAGIHAQPEGGIDQLRIVRRLGKRQIDLVGGGIVVVILLGHARGKVAAVERDQRHCSHLRAALRLRLGGWRGAALLGVADRRESEEQRCREQREGGASHEAHMLG